MGALRDTRQKFGIANELLRFLWKRKLWWLVPLLAVILLVGILIVTSAVTGVGPFVYTLF